MYKFVSFYTVDTPYEQEIKTLEKSLIKFNLDYHFEGYTTRGSWVQNCGIKPEFILQCLEDFPKHDIVYVDSDAEIVQQPTWFDDVLGDIAVHYLRDKELLSGTIYFKNCEPVKALIRLWINEQAKTPNVYDQKVLQSLLSKVDFVKVAKLPYSYVRIFDIGEGETVIEHHQASRRFRTMIPTISDVIPEQINGERIRRGTDGSLWMSNCSHATEVEMNKRFIRLRGELRWLPIVKTGKTLKDLAKAFDHRLCYIVGKGPSLDFLDVSYVNEPFAPVICINEAIHAVEKLGLPNPLFVMQQDASLRDTCKPQKATLLVSQSAKNWYKDVEDKYVYHQAQFGLSNTLTAACAVRLAQSLGITKFEFLCFDACVNKKITYAKCIGHEPDNAGDPIRFLRHRTIFEQAANGKENIVWTIPTSPDSTLYGRPQPLLHSQIEHHVPVQTELSGSLQSTVDQVSRTEQSEHASLPDHSDKSQTASYPDTDDRNAVHTSQPQATLE